MNLMTILKTKLVDWFINWLRGWAEIEDAPPAEKSAAPQEKFLGRWMRYALNKMTGRVRMLTIGQSKYGGKANDLPGCFLDAKDMAARAGSFGSRVEELHNLNKRDTQSKIEQFLADHNGGTSVLHYSAHGSFVKDPTGTEKDGKMEVICCADLGLISDDWIIGKAAEAATRGGNVILIFDTCHSGGMSRSIGAEVAAIPPSAKYIPEVMIPGEKLDEFLVERSLMPIPKADPSTITVMMACEESSYSYDTPQGGAYTQSLLRAIRRKGNATTKDLHDEVRKSLPSTAFPQVPQFDGRSDTTLFG